MTRISAVQAASDALNELGVNQSEPVDPFEAIEDAGLILSFQPLTDLLGAILPGEPAGVLINSARPPSLQRFTAAHELGHWFMDRNILSLDTDASVLGSDGADRELDAQIFAAHFLMPLELLHASARRYGISRNTLARPDQVYQAARDMHVSYEAAVRQMAVTRLITYGNSRELLKAKPATIKQGLTDGLTLPNARGDVWIVEDSTQEVEIDAFVGDAILLRLRENPSTGYRWCADAAVSMASVHQFQPAPAPAPFAGGRAFADTLESVGEVIPLPVTDVPSEVVTLLRDRVIRDEFSPGVTPVGGPVTRLVAYSATSPGEESIHLREIRPVLPAEPIARLEVTTRVRGMPDVEFRHRLLAAFAAAEGDY